MYLYYYKDSILLKRRNLMPQKLGPFAFAPTLKGERNSLVFVADWAIILYLG